MTDSFQPSLGIVFAAAGHSERFGSEEKLLAPYHGVPLFCHSLLTLVPVAASAVLVVSPEKEASMRLALQQHLPKALLARVQITLGGASRAESVWRGLQELSKLPVPPALVAVHDAARPLVTQRILLACCQTVQTQGGGAIPAHRVCDTIHQVNGQGVVTHTPRREALWAAETPQVFPFPLLCQAFETVAWRTSPPTDEGALLLQSGLAPVQIVENPDANPKITFCHELAALP